MFLLTISLMQLRRGMGHSLKSSRIEVVDSCSVGYVARIIIRRIVIVSGW